MSTHLPRLDVGSGRQRGALTLFPVWIDEPSVRGLEWSTTGLDVGELPTGASVGRLVVGNPTPRPAVLLEGDLLVGGMQHRMAASSTLLPARESMAVDVLCVEHGRWYEGRLACAELTVVPGAGHLLPLDRWAEILAAAIR